MQHSTLQVILRALVTESGYPAVLAALDACNAYPPGKKEPMEELVPRRVRKPRVRTSAKEVVRGLKVVEEEKELLLLELADDFEDKTFMPNVPSVQAFLEQQGVEPTKITSREQAARRVFKCLSGWETEKLCEWKKRGLYRGPKSLSVISGAIEKAGQRLSAQFKGEASMGNPRSTDEQPAQVEKGIT